MPAENKVDRIVHDSFFAGQRSGVVLEIGAGDPDFLSISALFRAEGWRVIEVEANPVFAALHRARGHEILEVACSDKDANDVDFVIVEADGTVKYQGKSIT